MFCPRATSLPSVSLVVVSCILSLAILLAVCIVATAPSATASFAKPMKFSDVRFVVVALKVPDPTITAVPY